MKLITLHIESVFYNETIHGCAELWACAKQKCNVFSGDDLLPPIRSNAQQRLATTLNAANSALHRELTQIHTEALTLYWYLHYSLIFLLFIVRFISLSHPVPLCCQSFASVWVPHSVEHRNSNVSSTKMSKVMILYHLKYEIYRYFFPVLVYHATLIPVKAVFSNSTLRRNWLSHIVVFTNIHIQCTLSCMRYHVYVVELMGLLHILPYSPDKLSNN